MNTNPTTTLTLDQITKSGANISIVVSSQDLRDFGNMLLAKAMQQFAAPKEEKYLRVSEVAQMLGVDRSTLYRWDKVDGYLHPIRVGGKPRYKLSEIEKLMG